MFLAAVLNLTNISNLPITKLSFMVTEESHSGASATFLALYPSVHSPHPITTPNPHPNPINYTLSTSYQPHPPHPINHTLLIPSTTPSSSHQSHSPHHISPHPIDHTLSSPIDHTLLIPSTTPSPHPSTTPSPHPSTTPSSPFQLHPLLIHRPYPPHPINHTLLTHQPHPLQTTPTTIHYANSPLYIMYSYIFALHSSLCLHSSSPTLRLCRHVFFFLFCSVMFVNKNVCNLASMCALV